MLIKNETARMKSNLILPQTMFITRHMSTKKLKKVY